MRYTIDMVALQTSPETKERYRHAENLLEHILAKKFPHMEDLYFLYGDLAPDMNQAILLSYTNPSFKPGRVRVVDDNAPTLLSDMQILSDKDHDFKKLYSYFAPQIDRDELKRFGQEEGYQIIRKEVESAVGQNIRNIYGPYADSVINTSSLALLYKLNRKANISMVTHWLGVSGIIYCLQREGHITVDEENRYFLPTAGFHHDGDEEFPHIVKDVDGMPYGIVGTPRFEQKYISEDRNLILLMRLVTNIYSSVLKQAYKQITNAKESFTPESLKDFLKEDVTETDTKTYWMPKVKRKILMALEDGSYEDMKDQQLFSAVNWAMSKRYQRRIVSKCEEEQFKGAKHPRGLYLKYSDLGYNFIGRDGLSDEDVIKNLLKVWFMTSATKASSIHDPLIDKFSQEMINDIAVYSRFTIIKDLMSPQASTLFYYSTFNSKILKLQPILYTDRSI